MTLGKRIGSIIAIMLVLMAAVGIAGYSGLSRVLAVAGFYRDIKEAAGAVANVSAGMDRYLLTVAMGSAGSRPEMIKDIQSRLSKVLIIIEEMKESIDQQSADRLASVKKNLNEYAATMNDYFPSESKKGSMEVEVEKAYDLLLETVGKGILWFDEELSTIKVFKGVSIAYLKKSSEENWKNTEAEFAALNKVAGEWLKRVAAMDHMKDVSNSLQGALGDLKQKQEDCGQTQKLSSRHCRRRAAGLRRRRASICGQPVACGRRFCPGGKHRGNLVLSRRDVVHDRTKRK
jgi:hypothetical protein